MSFWLFWCMAIDFMPPCGESPNFLLVEQTEKPYINTCMWVNYANSGAHNEVIFHLWLQCLLDLFDENYHKGEFHVVWHNLFKKKFREIFYETTWLSKILKKRWPFTWNTVVSYSGMVMQQFNTEFQHEPVVRRLWFRLWVGYLCLMVRCVDRLMTTHIFWDDAHVDIATILISGLSMTWLQFYWFVRKSDSTWQAATQAVNQTRDTLTESVTSSE